MTNTTQFTPVLIDGQPYGVKLLTSEEWDRVIDTVGADNKLLHYSKTASWVQDKADDWSSRYIVRGGRQARTKESYHKNDRGPLVGFRPCLVPLNSSTFKPDSSRFFDIKDGELLTFGTLHMDDSPACVPIPKTRNSEGRITQHYCNFPICISDSADKPSYWNADDLTIQWVKAGDLLVADRNLITHVSWQQLDSWGLVFGTGEKTADKDQPLQDSQDLDSLNSLIAMAKTVSDQASALADNLQRHKNNLER